MLKAYKNIFEGKTSITNFKEPYLEPFKGVQVPIYSKTYSGADAAQEVLFSEIDYNRDTAVWLQAFAFRDWWVENGNKAIEPSEFEKLASIKD